MKKTRASATSRLAQIIALSSSVILSSVPLHAATTTIFWDPNGTTSIGGNAIWNTTKEWSTATNQVATNSLVAWNDSNNYVACFSAGPISSASQGSLTVTVNRTNVCSGIDNGTDGPGSCFLTLIGGATGMLSLSGTVNTGGATQGSTTINIPIIGSNAITFNGAWTCTLNGTNTYSGITILNGGTLALGSKGSINNSTEISIAGGTTFDVSAIPTYNLSAVATLKATGSGQPATINGGTTVNLGSQPILLTSDGTHPSLTVAQGILSLNGNPFTVNKAIPLTVGDHTLITQSNGSILSTGTFTVAGTGIPAGSTATIAVNGSNVVLTITNVPTTTTVGPLTNAVYGQPVTFVATVAPAPSGGTVQFYDNGNALGGPITLTGATASYTANGLSVGNHPITAAYTGGGGYFSSTSTNTAVETVVLPANSAPVNITNVSLLPNGNVQMAFAGVAGYTYVIQATSDLNPPIQWTNIGTNTADANGLFNFTDTTATNTGNRYYQTEVQQ